MPKDKKPFNLHILEPPYESIYHKMTNESEFTSPRQLPQAPNYNDFLAKFNLAKVQVPKYEGGSKRLNFFLQNAQKFINNLQTVDENLNSYIFAYIISQIQGEAGDLVALYNPNTFDELRNLLLQKYREPWNESNLLQLLRNCFQKIGENTDEFYQRINELLIKLKEGAQIDFEQEPHTLRLKFIDYDNQALNSFIVGLNEPYRSVVIWKEPKDLPSAIQACRSHDNTQAQIDYIDFIRKTNEKLPIKNKVVPPQNNYQSFKTNTPVQPRSNFPTGPMNFTKPRQIQPHFPRNIQAFQPSKQTNVFKPGQNVPTNRVTPMSGITRFSKFNQPSNHFYNAQKNPNIIVEELYNTEENPPNENSGTKEEIFYIPEGYYTFENPVNQDSELDLPGCQNENENENENENFLETSLNPDIT